MTYIDNLFIESGDFVICDRFISIVNEFMIQFIESSIVGIRLPHINWMYVFTNEIAILQQIRYKNFKVDKIPDNSFDQLVYSVHCYRNKILAHPECKNLSDILTEPELNDLDSLLSNPVKLLHVYQYIHEDLYERLVESNKINECGFNFNVIKLDQQIYKEIKHSLLNKLNIDEVEFRDRWNNALIKLDLYKLNHYDSKPRRINFIFGYVVNE